MERAIRANNLIPNPILYTYRPGGAMGIAMRHFSTQGGRSDAVLAMVSALVLTPMQMDIGTTRQDLTNIAVIGTQDFFFWAMRDVAQREGWRDINDLLRSTRPITISNHGAGSIEEVLALYLQSRAPNLDLRLVPVSGDPEAMAFLLGGHIDIFTNELAGGGIESYIASGEVVALANTGATRSSFAPHVPTLTELGHAFTVDAFRGVVGPPNMSREALAWWQDLMRRIANTDVWREYLHVNGIEPTFLIGEEMARYLDEWEETMIAGFRIANIPVRTRR
jgi:putative tricarboxylic transport membrane protein